MSELGTMVAGWMVASAMIACGLTEFGGWSVAVACQDGMLLGGCTLSLVAAGWVVIGAQS